MKALAYSQPSLLCPSSANWNYILLTSYRYFWEGRKKERKLRRKEGRNKVKKEGREGGREEGMKLRRKEGRKKES